MESTPTVLVMSKSNNGGNDVVLTNPVAPPLYNDVLDEVSVPVPTPSRKNICAPQFFRRLGIENINFPAFKKQIRLKKGLRETDTSRCYQWSISGYAFSIKFWKNALHWTKVSKIWIKDY